MRVAGGEFRDEFCPGHHRLRVNSRALPINDLELMGWLSRHLPPLEDDPATPEGPPQGAGRDIGITCSSPVHRGGAVRVADLSGHAAAEVVKQRAQQAGLDPADFSGHSLRSGFSDQRGRGGRVGGQDDGRQPAPEHGHAVRHVRSADLFKEPAGTAFL
jgi:hypothetical protein